MVSVPVEPRPCHRRWTVRPGLPLDPALKGEACARNSRQGTVGESQSRAAERLLSTESSGARLFATQQRERSIGQAAVEGSPSGTLFVGGEALEALGADATRELDKRVPDLDQSVPSTIAAPLGPIRALLRNGAPVDSGRLPAARHPTVVPSTPVPSVDYHKFPGRRNVYHRLLCPHLT